MQEFKHSSGTWSVHERDDKFAVVTDDNPFGFGEIFICEGIEQGHDSGEADAKLIAAAPDLLAVAHRFLYDENCIDGNHYQEFVAEVQAAYDKATK